MEKNCGISLSIFFTLILMAVQVSAVPPMPMEFYGTVLLDGNPAPVGTIISAQVNGIDKGSLTTTVAGFYGGPAIFDNRLKIFIAENEYRPGENYITFFINGWQTDETVEYIPGKSVQLDLSSGVKGDLSLSTTTPLLSPTPVSSFNETTGTGWSESGTSTITYGLDQRQVFTSDDGLAEVLFEKDTMLFSPEGQFLNAVGIKTKKTDAIPPLPQTGAVQFSGYAYEIIPETTYFNPKGVLTLRLPPERTYEIIRSTPVLYEYLPQTASWEQINTDTNMFANTISADIYEAAIYGLFVSPNTITSNNTIESSSVQVVPFSDLNSNQSIPPPILSTTESSAVIESISSPQPMITPSDIITPLPSPVNQSAIITPVTDINGSPTLSESGQTITTTKNTLLNISVISKVLSVLSEIKSRFTGPVIGVMVISFLIIVTNALVYVVYKSWWEKRKDQVKR